MEMIVPNMIGVQLIPNRIMCFQCNQMTDTNLISAFIKTFEMILKFNNVGLTTDICMRCIKKKACYIIYELKLM